MAEQSRDDGSRRRSRSGPRREDGSADRSDQASGPRKRYVPHHGERRRPDRDASSRRRDGSSERPREADRKPSSSRDGGFRPASDGNGDRGSRSSGSPDRRDTGKRDSARASAPHRDGSRKSSSRDGARPPRGERAGGSSRDDRRGSSDRRSPQRPVRGRQDDRTSSPRHPDPVLPDDVTPQELNGGARNELKTLSKENAEQVARHLAMVARLVDDDPALAHQHALAASLRAGRIAIVRETLAITAYTTGDYALALRELRTFRRISGRDDQIALMVDSERGVGRPDRALELGRSVERSTLPVDVRVELAIAMSGARLDLGQPDRALAELDIPELDPDRAFDWSPGLFAARAAVLEELGRTGEAAQWRRRAEVAADALDAAHGVADRETIEIEEIEEIEEILDVEQSVDVDGVDSSGTAADATTDPEQTPDASSGDAENPAGHVSIEDEVSEILIEAGVDDESERRD